MSADFLDSNVFIYAVDDSNEAKREVARLTIQAAIAGDAAISYQVVQETLNVITKKFTNSTSGEEAARILDSVLSPLWRVMPSEALFRRGLELQRRYRYGFYDSMIVAAALDAGCTRLLSEDLQDGQRIEGLTIVNPFRGA